MRIARLPGNPIIRPHMDARMGTNINGPSLIRVPHWLKDPLGTYYLYFADHKGHYIRLAYADQLEGPWRMYEPGTLQLEQSHLFAAMEHASRKNDMMSLLRIEALARGLSDVVT